MTQAHTDHPVPGPNRAERAAAHASVNPWVLLQLGEGPERGWVVAEGAHPRRHTRLTRTRVAGSAAVADRLPAVLDATRTQAQPQVGTVYLPTGAQMRVITVPVLGPADTVDAVQLWAGPRSRPPPARPTVGALHWSTPGTGIATTTPGIDLLLDTDTDTGRGRTLPDLLGHLEHLDDREGLLRLLDPATDVLTRRWSAIAVTRALAGGPRRSLFIAAVRDRDSTDVRAVVTDITATHPPAQPSITVPLLRAIPIRANHAIGIVDLPTGLVHEWIHPGSAPLDRWQRELPTVHPEDQPELAKTRARLAARADHATTTVRIRFDADDPWTTVHADWTVLTRDTTPQAMLDLRLARETRGRTSTEAQRTD
ncbi:GAF domain-containing protein [Nocardia takedensis]|uniref:GAF domain-containing protein n=1 Tax=Nocardia takedensis TaxID=259390 RepID=UPI000315DFEB|nr:GAF domain-containing protein [Nocardia takedensis]